MVMDPGRRFGTSRQNLASMLMQQEQAAPPIQANTQGLASLLRQGLAGYMQGADAADRASAYQTMIKGLTAQPWVNPDTGRPMGTAGGLAGAEAALAGMAGNEYAAEMLPQLGMQRYAEQRAKQQRAEEFEQAKELLGIKASMQKPVPGRDVPYAPEVASQLTDIAAARAAAMRPDIATIKAEEAAKAEGRAAVETGKPLPAAAVKIQNDLIENIGLTKGIEADMSAVQDLLSSGEMDLGPVQNKIYQAQNYAGASTKESRNYQSFMSTLEKLRNDSLRLNNGVQTEGDAVRAWNELFTNVNDREYVKQRLAEIKRINSRASDLKQFQLDELRRNYGKPSIENMPSVSPAIGGGLSTDEQMELEALRKRFGK